MGLCYGLWIRLVNLVVFFLVVIMIPGLPPKTTFPFKPFDIVRPRELKGALEPNQHLEGAERLLDGRVYGPECLIERNREIYMGIHGGEVIKVNGNHVTHVTKLGQPCEEIYEESRCGRPLGLAFDTQGNNLLVADAYYGIWEVDLSSGKKKQLVSPYTELPGKNIDRRAKIFNSVTVDKSGTIYFTDSSSDFTIQDLIYTTFANPSGRLFEYDRKSNITKVLVDELFFANGVALSPEEDFIIVAETGGMRLTKYYLKGPKKGQSEIFVEGLPGLPDNITPDKDGLWVPLVTAADEDHPSGFAIFSNFPSLRAFFARLLRLAEMPFMLWNNLYPNKIAQRFVHFIGHGESVSILHPKRSTILRVDWNGNIVGSLHGFDKSVGSVSHVLEASDKLVLGSPFNRFVAIVKNPKAKQPSVKIRNVRVEGMNMEMEPVVEMPTSSQTAKNSTPKPSTTTARPTTTTSTTTPKPTTTTRATTTTSTTRRPTTTTPKPTTTTTAQPKTQTNSKPVKKPRAEQENPAPVKEQIPSDTAPPKKEKLKVINREGAHVEL